MTWTRYPKADGYWAQHGAIVLTAFADGTWATWVPATNEELAAFERGERIERTNRPRPRSSADFASSTRAGLEDARRCAMAAALEMELELESINEKKA